MLMEKHLSRPSVCCASGHGCETLEPRVAHMEGGGARPGRRLTVVVVCGIIRHTSLYPTCPRGRGVWVSFDRPEQEFAIERAKIIRALSL